MPIVELFHAKFYHDRYIPRYIINTHIRRICSYWITPVQPLHIPNFCKNFQFLRPHVCTLGVKFDHRSTPPHPISPISVHCVTSVWQENPQNSPPQLTQILALTHSAYSAHMMAIARHKLKKKSVVTNALVSLSSFKHSSCACAQPVGNAQSCSRE